MGLWKEPTALLRESHSTYTTLRNNAAADVIDVSVVVKLNISEEGQNVHLIGYFAPCVLFAG